MTATTNTNIMVELHSQETVTDDIKNCEISNGNNIRRTNDSSNNDQATLEILQCFVCDIKVHGRHYSLATCRTQSTRGRVIEKLGELVGERYMVVISEDDVICRSCANLMNTLDRLEAEMKGVRSTILHFLERKYSLDEGELLGNSDPVKLCQPPQITKSHPQNTNSYHGRKRAAVSPSTFSNDNKQKKSHVWMQCDKCRYTTQHNAFMVHHIRQHIKHNFNCDKCGIPFQRQQKFAHSCTTKKEDKRDNYIREDYIEVDKSDSIEASNLKEINIGMHTKPEILQVISHPTNSEISNAIKQESVQLIRLSTPGDLQIQGIIAADSSTASHPLLVRVLQHVDIEQEQLQSQDIIGTNTAPGMMVKVKENYGGKQMLTLTEDGSLEMVEVACWDDVQPSDHTLI
ncbi:uncharacterized protein LOC107270420 isoform X2 [Cephus cinctus]|nr:uncharacterized protein LOC107270420 isoform X2 [Cephus cinctus]XP_015600912.1 uncharacterized protein LOC107270420 isoform X2 [Cephus cinctus]XP_015600913.1 uncharacterized protein LOC107270420 isoform X2 [Cephus cinctus]XP_024943543.1 uncharacterized protein LOC107270420 isoform X2 [Cephus cinctus]XP_024943544.1 uncharacterized protein LOC107270420 isoform X2 [Cephus cinctus]